VTELALPVSYWWDCCLFLDGEGRGEKGRRVRRGEEITLKETISSQKHIQQHSLHKYTQQHQWCLT